MTAHLIMVVDKSGSMYPLTDDVIGGFNGFLENLSKDEKFDYRATVILFDTAYKVLCVNAPLREVPRLDHTNYWAAGNTALFDAVGRAISEFKSRVPELGEDEKVTLVIQTDGQENASIEYRSASAVKQMIDGLKATGKWNIAYIGAGEDTWTQARAMGVDRNTYLNTAHSKGATASTYGAMAQSVNRSFTGDVDWMEDIKKANK